MVLWSRSFTPAASHTAASSASPVNSLVREALIEGRSSDGKYEKDGYAVKWTFVNDLELIFVVSFFCLVTQSVTQNGTFAQVAYQRILQLTYVDELLAALKTLFVKLFQPFLATFVASLHVASAAKLSASSDISTWNFKSALDGWDTVFDKLLRGLEDKAAQVRRLRPHTSTLLMGFCRKGAHAWPILPM